MNRIIKEPNDETLQLLEINKYLKNFKECVKCKKDINYTKKSNICKDCYILKIIENHLNS